MSNTEILATVHRWMKQSMEREESVAVMGNRLVDCKEYIDEQWKLQEEHEEWRNEVFAKNDDGQMYKAQDALAQETQAKSLGQFSETWYDKRHAACHGKEANRHRELEIGEDGTVTNLK